MEIDLFEKQHRFVQCPSSIVLATGDGGGKSHAIRVGCAWMCMSFAGTIAAIIHPLHQELVREHVEGRTGLKSLLASSVTQGNVEFRPGEVKFANGSRLLWIAADKQSDLRRFADEQPKHVAFDDLHRIAQELFETVALRVEIAGGRVWGCCPPLDQAGWVAPALLKLSGRVTVFDISNDDLPEKLKVIQTIPTCEEFMEKLGIPFLASDSSFRQAPYVKKVVNVLQRWFWGEFQRLMLLMPTQCGKAVVINTPIRSSTGWTTMGELEVGDEVYAVDGTLTTVTWKSEPEEQLVYEVTSDDGYTVECHSGHEWVVTLDKRSGWKRKTTEHLHERQNGKSRNPRLHIHGALQIEPRDLPLDPWILGLWLSDGSDLNSFRLGHGADKDIDYVEGRLSEHFFVRREMMPDQKLGATPSLICEGLAEMLDVVGLPENERGIPRLYFDASCAQRLELLQGLVDADGTVDARTGQIEYCTTRKRLARDVRELIVGLGIKVSMSESPSVCEGKEYSTRYRICFFATDVATIPRKKRRLKKKVEKVHRYLTVEKTNRRAKMQCISVDHPSHQYLCGEGLLATHNTILGIRMMDAYIVHCRPWETVGLVSYNDRIAIDRNRDAREFYRLAGGAFLPGAGGQEYWKTPFQGGSWATGFGGGAGNPMSWALLDDPDENMEDSRSETRIRKKETWYVDTWLGREAKHAAKGSVSFLTVATRFWFGDTVKRTIDIHLKRGEPWHILALSALFDPQVGDYYRAMDKELITVEPDFRTTPGEALDPERYDREFWLRTKKATVIVFESRDQQKPVDAEGGTKLDQQWLIDIPVDPAYRADAGSELDVYRKPGRAWDFAATAGAGDFTASLKGGTERASDRIVLRHGLQWQLGPKDVLRIIAGCMLVDGNEVSIILSDDPASGGKQQTDRVVEYLRYICRLLTLECRNCGGARAPDPTCRRCGGEGEQYFERPPIRTVPVKGSRFFFDDLAERAKPISKTIEGRVDYVRAQWLPKITDTIPWYWEAADQHSRDDRAELEQIDALLTKLLLENQSWWVDYLRIWHLFPNVIHDDAAMSLAYWWQWHHGKKSVYPGLDEDPIVDKRLVAFGS